MSIGVIIIVIAIIIFLAAITYDVRVIRFKKRIARYRPRPFVSVIISKKLNADSLKHIKKSEYRKQEIISKEKLPHGTIYLELCNNVILPPYAIRDAVARLHIMKSSYVEIKPFLTLPESIWQLFQSYRRLIIAPFVAARAQLNIYPMSYAKWPTLHKSTAHSTGRTYIYEISRWILSAVNALVLAYLLFMAVWLSQPEPLLLYLCAFWLWLIIAIWDYPHASFKDKFLYTILAPVSFGYFLVIALISPFMLLARFSPNISIKLLVNRYDKYKKVSRYQNN